jgi:single-strand DNA-binding protein
VASLNRWSGIGNLTRDPEKREVGEKTLTKFAIAINRKTKGGDETTFIDVIAWDKLGDVCATYLKKGMMVLIEGRLSVRKYEDKDGNKRTAVEIIATEMQMLDRKSTTANGVAQETPADMDEALDTVPF